MMDVKLRLTQSAHQELRTHLFPGDGLEAVAWRCAGADGAANVIA